MSTTQPTTIHKSCILVAEDSADDRLLLECAFARARVEAVLNFVSDGQQVLNYLQHHPPFEDSIKNRVPSLILLDLQMPVMNGFEVLEWLRQRPQFGNIAVVVYSGTDQRSAMSRARVLGARHYLIKPQSLQQLVVMARSLGTFLKVAELSAPHSAAVGC